MDGNHITVQTNYYEIIEIQGIVENINNYHTQTFTNESNFGIK